MDNYDTVHPAIAQYRREHPPIHDPLSAMLDDVEQSENKAAVIKVLTETIPHLYAAEYTDEETVPVEVFALIERLQIDLDIEFPF